MFPDHHPTVTIGNFNAKSRNWNCRNGNQRGRQLARTLDIVVVAPESPTYYLRENQVPEILDVAIVQNITITEIEVLDEGSSDHNPILFTIGRGEVEPSNPTKRIIDWKIFQHTIHDEIGDIPHIETNTDLENST
ncbi:uncharacterized protein [Leptinotarsa decemlineata]|uniref:uncharacterized protein n=1 Tax=Leptinotarsa decemlineata TaxID=7539 RepID=UPI003D309E9E